MSNAETKRTNESELVDLYANQLKYNKYMEKKMFAYKIIFLLSAIITFVLSTIDVMPIYGYHQRGNINRGMVRIMGDYTPIVIIQKILSKEIPQSALSLCMVAVLIIMIVLSVYLVVGGLVNLAAHKLLADNKIMNKLFNYGMLEIIATVFFIAFFASMIFAKVDLMGNVDNLEGFWILFASSVVMICTSIPLSTKK